MEWFTTMWVPNLRIQKWHYKAVPLSQSKPMALIYFTVQDADVKAIQKSLGKTIQQLWLSFCQMNRVNPDEVQLKSSDPDPRKKYLRHIKFRVTRPAIDLLRAAIAPRQANQVFWFGSAYNLKAKNEVALSSVTNDQLNWEARGEGPVFAKAPSEK